LRKVRVLATRIAVSDFFRTRREWFVGLRIKRLNHLVVFTSWFIRSIVWTVLPIVYTHSARPPLGPNNKVEIIEGEPEKLLTSHLSARRPK
jgi:hypothetical protein